MKIAILSDIHGNFDALFAISSTSQFLKCDLKLNLGDSVGYYFQPSQVLNLIEELGFISVRGNHEVFLSQALDSPKYLDFIDINYGSGLRECINNVSSEKLYEITNWPKVHNLETQQGLLVAAHGSVKSESDYVYPDSDLNQIGQQIDSNTRWLCLGNTHWPMLRFFNTTTIINPGSVGQPRNCSTGANWAVLDTCENSVNFIETEYDTSNVVKLTKMKQPNMPKLWEIFTK